MVRPYFTIKYNMYLSQARTGQGASVPLAQGPPLAHGAPRWTGGPEAHLGAPSDILIEAVNVEKQSTVLPQIY